MELYSIVTNTDPSHSLYQSPNTIKFSVLMYDSNCLWNSIDHDAVWLFGSGPNDIPFTIEYGNSPINR